MQRLLLMLCLLAFAFLALSCGMRKTNTTPSNILEFVWKDNSGNEKSYSRKVKTEKDFTQIATVDEKIIIYSNTGLHASTTYYYRVCAYKLYQRYTYSALAFGAA